MNLPYAILNIDGRKSYKMKLIEDPKNPKDILKVYLERGFTEENFYEVYCLGKSALFHNSIALAIKV
jgi:hypothetical protein